MKFDQWGRRQITEDDLCDLLYVNPSAPLHHAYLEDPTLHNNAIKTNYSDLSTIGVLEHISMTPDEWHASNQQKWKMPPEYFEMDIVKWILDQCSTDEELQRCGMEILEFSKRDLLLLLSYLKFLVDTLRSNKIVWGVGRGSSVASFVLYKIGIHRIDSLKYELDFYEFMK